MRARMNTYKVRLRYKGNTYTHYEVGGITSDTIMGAISAAKRKVIKNIRSVNGKITEEEMKQLSVVAIAIDNGMIGYLVN